MAGWHALGEKEVLAELGTGEKGLSEQEAKARLRKYGKNIIREVKRVRPLFILLEQFLSLFIYILAGAAIISAFLGHWLDFFVIFGIVLVNGFLGFVQQYKAERAIEELRGLLVLQATVLRNGKLEKILSEDIVPGDILVLAEGDRVPADAGLIFENSLQTNEAVLTGESLP